jgi:hypothetical protein
MNEHLRAVIWPRGKKEQEGKPPAYRYMIVGVLVTDEPIAGLDKNQYVINQRTFGLKDQLESMQPIETDLRLGDANQALAKLKDLPEMLQEEETSHGQ